MLHYLVTPLMKQLHHPILLFLKNTFMISIVSFSQKYSTVKRLHPLFSAMMKTILPGLLMLCCITIAKAQPGTLTCNVPERMNTSATHPSMSQTNSGALIVVVLVRGVEDAANVYSASTTDYASMTSILGTEEYLSVKDGAAGAGGYPAGSFAGFEIETGGLLSLAAFSNVSISTYLGGALVQTKAVDASLLSASLLTTGARGTVGFVASSAFDEVRISTSAVLALGTIKIYNAVFEKFCAGPALPCNTATIATSPTYPLTINNAHTGMSGVTVGSITNTDQIIDASTSNYGSINFAVGIFGSASVAVLDNVSTYPAGTFAGIDIESASLLSVGVLDNMKLETYLDGVATGEVVTGANLLAVGSSLLAGSGRQVLGFRATQAFDEIRFTASSVVGLPLSSIRVYGVVLERFCSAPLPACNTLTAVTNPVYPVFVDGKNTAADGLLCAACAISNSQNAIDNDPSNYASIVLTAGVATNAQFAVANALDSFAAGTFAGFDIETNPLLLAAVISNASISLYNNGSLVQVAPGNALIVGATTSLLSTTTRQIVGVIAQITFDEVKISFNQLVGADLGTIKIYSAIFEPTCTPAILCNKTYYLNNPAFPAIIDAQKTGLSGLVSVAASVRDPWNVVSASTTDFARISSTAAVGTAASIAVLDPRSTYPEGTFAGFVINTSSAPLVLLDLFNAITISTYNNGTLQESRSGGSLLDLTVLIPLLGSPGGARYNIGFETTKEFDEIRISVSSLVGVGLLGGDYIDVYSAFIDTRTSSASSPLITCIRTMPDINATFIGVAISGNVKTNDQVPTPALYGTPVASASNPTATLPVMSSNGSYTFSTLTKGVYEFDVPISMPAGVDVNPMEMLTIQVLDHSTGATNKPVVNTDIAVTAYNTPVAVKALANDAIGTPGAKLDTGSLAVLDLNGPAPGVSAKAGTASVSMVTGSVTYTPPSGFAGYDTLRYTICDNQGVPLCGSAYIIITVLEPTAKNTVGASDDYKQTVQGTSMTGNVRANDMDPEGDTMSIASKTVSVPGQYSFTLNTDGSFVFAPDLTYMGPLAFDYTVCDDASPAACANATLYMLISPLAFPLPIELQSFRAATENCTVQLNWASSSEKGLKAYIVQYSTNGTAWTDVSTVKPSGTGGKYELSHTPGKGKGFYRLKMIEEEGRFTYSEVLPVQLSCEEGGDLLVYPIPAARDLHVVSRNFGADNTYSITDALGQVKVTGRLETKHTVVDLSGLGSGSYMIRVMIDGNSKTRRFSVLK